RRCARAWSRSPRKPRAARGRDRCAASQQANRAATRPRPAHGRMCTVRIVLVWVGAVVVLAASLVAGVAVANATVFSASGFVRDYLTTLADGRVDEVLALPGVDAHALDERMLDPAAIAAFDWRVLGEHDDGRVHRVSVAFDAPGVSERTTLHVERIGTRFGLFPEWGFAVSPVTALEVTMEGDTRVT